MSCAAGSVGLSCMRAYFPLMLQCVDCLECASSVQVLGLGFDAKALQTVTQLPSLVCLDIGLLRQPRPAAEEAPAADEQASAREPPSAAAISALAACPALRSLNLSYLTISPEQASRQLARRHWCAPSPTSLRG